MLSPPPFLNCFKMKKSGEETTKKLDVFTCTIMDIIASSVAIISMVQLASSTKVNDATRQERIRTDD